MPDTTSPACGFQPPTLSCTIRSVQDIQWVAVFMPPQANPPPGRKPTFDTDDYHPRRVVERYLPPIVDIPLKRPSELAGEVTDDELVLGVEINGQARADPINQ